MAVWAPLLNQVPGNGIAKKTLLWHSAWIFVMVYMNTCYLAFLSSLEMVPQVRTTGSTFHDLEKQNFYLFPTPKDSVDLTFEFYAYKTREKLGFTDITGASDFDENVIADYLKLKDLLQDRFLTSMEPDEAREFLKLESKAWIARDFDSEALKKVAKTVLKCSYNELRERFNSVPTFVQMEVVYGEIVPLYYSYLVDAGFTSLWSNLYHTSVSINYEQRYLTVLGANGTNNGKEIDVAPVVIHDALVLESVCSYGIGLALALITYEVSMCYGCWRKFTSRDVRERHPQEVLTVKG